MSGRLLTPRTRGRAARMLALGCALVAAVAGGAAGAAESPRSAETGQYRNLFRAWLGHDEPAVDAKIEATWQQLFYGRDDTQRIYYPVTGDMAYIADIGNNDVRSEGISYGMMIAVQLDRRSEFDRIWRWAKTHMQHADGPRAGYFAWHCRFDGTPIDPGSASDGEEWIAMALLFASHRWGDGEGALDYQGEAQRLLHLMRHKPATSGVTPIFDPARKQVVFAPTPRGSRLTDPSYHLPMFYELWARWSRSPADRVFWAEAAQTSRAFLRSAAHWRTGLMPEYAGFDGRPDTGLGAEKGDFRFDAWRTLAHVALDHAWFGADPWQREQSTRVLRFLHQHWPNVPNQFALDGTPLSTGTSPGLLAMAAVAGLAAEPDVARPFVERLWQMPIPAGRWRYYDGVLYMLALLEVSGRFRVHAPATDVNPK